MAHPPAKPVAVIKDALMGVSARGDIVLDRFLGGGAPRMAAEARGRVARGVELDPLCVDVVLRHWRSAKAGKAARKQDGARPLELETHSVAVVAS